MKKRFKEYISTEDWWAIWLGFIILFFASFVYQVPKFDRWEINPISTLTFYKIFLFFIIMLSIMILFAFALFIIHKTKEYKRFVKSFPIIFLLALVAFVMSSQVTVKAFGLGYAFWSLFIGLLISNTIGVPNWLKPALRTEFYIKTGLVLLGSEILFSRMAELGLPAMIVAWTVTPIVIIFMFYFGTKFLRLGKNITIVTAVATSVCGVSAAIAAAAASGAKKEELTLAISMTLIFTVFMMIAMPGVIQFLEIDPMIGGAWIGGTIDATGAVVAAGAALGEDAMHIAAIVKMIQNIMIGVVAFFIAIIWATNIDSSKINQKVTLLEIWYRFPKFIIGFIIASLFYSFILVPLFGQEIIIESNNISKSYRGLLFALAFVSIGLESNFKELKSYMAGGKPMVLYIVGQSLNLVLTIFVAWLAFGGILFDVAK